MQKWILARPVLVQTIQQALDEYRIVLLQAPAGYGKTALARAATLGRATVWYEVAPWDKDAFPASLVESVAQVHQDFGRRVRDLQAEGAAPDRLGAEFSAALSGVADPTVIVVIDDAHQLEEDAFSRFIEGAGKALPDQARILLLSRALPAFAAGELVLRGRLATYDARALAFGENDVAELIERGLDPSAVENAMKEAAGWPAGVDLLLRDGSERRRLADALANLVDADDAPLLQRLAVFETVDATALALCGSGSEARVRGLAQRGAMIDELPEGNGWRLHPMLRAMLLDRLRRHDAGAERAIHAEAAKAYARAGRIGPALFHLERSDDLKTMISLRRYTVDALLTGDAERIAKFAARARGAGIRDEPLFAFIAAYRAKTHGTSDVRRAFCAAADASDAAGDDLLAFESRIQIVEHELARGDRVDAARMHELRERGARLGPSRHASALVRAGWNEILHGRFEEALALATDAPSTGTIVETSLLVPLRAYAMTVLGFFDEADREMAAFLAQIEDRSPRTYEQMLVWAARLAWLRGEARAAADYAQHAHRIGKCYDFKTEAAPLALILAETAVHAENVDDALAGARDAEETAAQTWYGRDQERTPELARWLRLRARFLRKRDADAALAETVRDIGDAKQTVVRAALCADAAWYAEIAKDERAEQLRGRAASEAARAAAVDAYDVVTVADAAERVEFLARMHGENGTLPRPATAPFGALVAKRRGRTGFAELGERVHEDGFADLLARYQTRGRRFEAVLAERLAKRMPGRQLDGLPEPLTQRETQVLALLVNGLTNKEVAQRLALSPRTVEVHVANILAKMDVNSRARAISKAVRLGIVPEPA